MPGERAPRSGEDERNAELIRNKLQNISDEEINKAIDTQKKSETESKQAKIQGSTVK
jgi:hypothetical protein